MKTQKEAKRKYGEDWASHSAETDHINAIKDVHEKAKWNPFISDEDFKDVINSGENFRELSKTLNASKGAKSDYQLILEKDNGITEQGKRQMAKEKMAADVALHGRFAVKTAENLSTEFLDGAQATLSASVIPLTAEAVSNMVNIVQGKKDGRAALSDIGHAAVDTAIYGGRRKVELDIVTNMLENSENDFLKKIANNNEVIEILAVAHIVQESACRYLDGEISGEEFIDEVSEKGTIMVAALIGGEAGRELGGVVGAIIGTMGLPGPGTIVGEVAGQFIGEVLGMVITTISCSLIVSVYSGAKELKKYKEMEKECRRIEKEALREMEHQREKFKELLVRENLKWDERIDEGFKEILSFSIESNYKMDKVVEGLDKILGVYGKQARFHSVDEYEAQIGTTLHLKF